MESIRSGCSPAFLYNAVESFWDKGYVTLPNLFSPHEVSQLRNAIVNSPEMNQKFQMVQQKFFEGKYPSFESIFVWNDTSGDDIFAKFTRAKPILEIIEAAFRDDAYVYHNKVALKYPAMPGFKHHQDYFYWSTMGCLLPNMATCMIAVDDADRSNGCLRLVRGSHRLGRLEHTAMEEGDSQIEPERLKAILDRMPEDAIELKTGDAVLFHCNTIHASDANDSDRSRLALLGCYNTKKNDPYHRRCEHPPYIKQSKVVEPIHEDDATRLPDYSISYAEL